MKKFYFLLILLPVLIVGVSSWQKSTPQKLSKTINNQVWFGQQQNIKQPNLTAIDKKRYCLPMPNNDFIKRKAADKLTDLIPSTEKCFFVDDVYGYLLLCLDSLTPKKVLKTDPFYGPIEWEQEFKGADLL